MKRGRRFVYWCSIGMLAGMLVGCGYHFAGSGKYPAGVSRVYITMLQNRSGVTGAESTFTNDLIYEFTRNRPKSIAKDRSAADSILTGTIGRLSVEDIARSSISQAVERRVTATLILELASPDGRILWSSGAIQERQSYAVVAGDKTSTDRNKSNAIDKLAKKLAESAYDRLTDNF
jgi:outer membrane lipopolysaccharide assembly protein LptE/RlpB